MKTGPVFRHKIALNKTGRKRSRDIFSNTIQKTDVWLNDLMSELDWEDRPHKTYMALRTVLRALRDRLPVEEGIQLGAQLPMLIRGFYYESWNLKDKPHKERCKEDFLDDVKKAFKNDVTVHPQRVCQGVFKVLAKHGEIEDVKHMLLRPCVRCGRNDTPTCRWPLYNS